MAFPVTVATGYSGTKGCGGPFISSAGNVYVILPQDGGTATLFAAFKATDPTSSFAKQGSDINLVDAVVIIAACQVGDVIHVVSLNTGANYDLEYHTFNMATDAWVITAETIVEGMTLGVIGSNGGVGIMVRSDGDVIVGYNKSGFASMGSTHARIAYARRESSTWTVDVALDGAPSTAESYVIGGLVSGSSDRTHFFFKNRSTFAVYQRTLTSANALETLPAAFDTDGSSNEYSVQQTGISYSSGVKVRFPYIDDNGASINLVKLDSADAPTVSISTDITGTTAISSTDKNRSSLSADGTTLWNTFIDSAADLYTQSSAADAAWSTPELFLTGTVTNVKTRTYTRSSNVVIAMLYTEGNVGKHHEKVIGTGATAVSNDYTGSYAVSAAVAQSGIQNTYTVTATVAQSGVQNTYAVIATVAQSGIQNTYTVTAAVAQSGVQNTYTVTGIAQADRTENYAVLNSAQADRTENYAVIAAVAQSAAQSTYTVTGIAQADGVESYAVIAPVQSTATQNTYIVLKAVQTDSTQQTYSVIAAVQASVTGSYAVTGIAQGSVVGSYTVTSTVQSTATQNTYIVLAPVTTDAGQTYSVIAAVQANGAGAYAVPGVVQADRTESYSVFNTVQADSTRNYTVFNMASKDAACSYQVFSVGDTQVSQDAVMSYSVLNTVQSSVSGQWNTGFTMRYGLWASSLKITR